MARTRCPFTRIATWVVKAAIAAGLAAKIEKFEDGKMTISILAPTEMETPSLPPSKIVL